MIICIILCITFFIYIIYFFLKIYLFSLKLLFYLIGFINQTYKLRSGTESSTQDSTDDMSQHKNTFQTFSLLIISYTSFRVRKIKIS